MNETELLAAAKAYKSISKKHRGRLGKLYNYVEIIKYLRSARHFPFTEITRFFESQGIKVTEQTVIKTWKERKRIRAIIKELVLNYQTERSLKPEFRF